tara:strand:- start:17320 stop:17886 length:567 start_codon:yes stop_codon:yes gene_type:complete
MMAENEGRITIHMAASLDGYIAREDGSVDWMETADEYAAGEELDADYVSRFLEGIDCYLMGSGTYLTALDFEKRGLGWAYGDKPVLVLTSRALKRSRESVTFHSEDLQGLLKQLRGRYANIWVAGGGKLAGNLMRLGLADEIRYSILPVLIGKGISFFEGLDKDVALHLLESRAYRSGMVALRYAVAR